MKLPRPETLTAPEHVFLYEHDIQELHNPNAADFTHQMYLARFEAMLAATTRYARDGTVLDVGCAQGNLSLALAERGYHVVAMDLRLAYVRYLRLKYEHGDLSTVAASLERFPFRAESFDIVLLGEVLEHVAEPELLLRAARALLRLGGILIATTPNGGRFRTGLPTLSDIKDRAAVRLRQFQPDAGGHLFLLTPGELRYLVEQAGFAVVSHVLLATPWISGRLLARYLCRYLPVALRHTLDRVTSRTPVVSRWLSEGQLLVGRRAH